MQSFHQYSLKSYDRTVRKPAIMVQLQQEIKIPWTAALYEVKNNRGYLILHNKTTYLWYTSDLIIKTCYHDVLPHHKILYPMLS